eukprot:augustus_masked-scaffold_9-processed-gene-8.9-mRNA-1 protein AED:1.00 eAED:1.00 QI:0/-1/0/0/-1/1/1/0/575
MKKLPHTQSSCTITSTTTSFSSITAASTNTNHFLSAGSAQTDDKGAPCFLDDLEFNSLSIDTFNYSTESNKNQNNVIFSSQNNEKEFSLPEWAGFPGEEYGVVVSLVSSRTGHSFLTCDLDLPDKKYYVFGKQPTISCPFGEAVVFDAVRLAETEEQQINRDKKLSQKVVHIQGNESFCSENNNPFANLSPAVKKETKAIKNHFVIFHSNRGQVYFLDLNSVSGIYIGKDFLPKGNPVLLKNGISVIYIPEYDNLKIICRVFPKQLSKKPSFASFSGSHVTYQGMKSDMESLRSEFDESEQKDVDLTNLNTQLNQIPEFPSPTGRHLVKHRSFYDLANSQANIFSANQNPHDGKIKLPSQNSFGFHQNLPKKTNNFGKERKLVRKKGILKKREMELSFQPKRQVSFYDQKTSKSNQNQNVFSGFSTGNSKFGGMFNQRMESGLFSKKDSGFGFVKNTKSASIFSKSGSRFGSTSSLSKENNFGLKLKHVDYMEDDSDEELEAFDPQRDLPDLKTNFSEMRHESVFFGSELDESLLSADKLRRRKSLLNVQSSPLSTSPRRDQKEKVKRVKSFHIS